MPPIMRADQRGRKSSLGEFSGKPPAQPRRKPCAEQNWDIEDFINPQYPPFAGAFDAVRFVEYNRILAADGARVRLPDAETTPAQPSVVQGIG